VRLSIILLALALVAIGILYIAFLKNGFPRKQNNFANNSSSPAGIISQLPQMNSEGEVTVKVSPKDLTQSAASWDFEIILNTHSVELSYDLTQTSILRDEDGKEYRPLSWEGDPPGGHHREGLLSFSVISPKPRKIELIMREISRVAERRFLWITQP